MDSICFDLPPDMWANTPEEVGTVVWLRAKPETLARRVGDGAGRPLLGDDPAEAMVRLNEVRAPLYAEIADLVIDVDDLSPKAVAAIILERVVGAQAPTDAANNANDRAANAAANTAPTESE